MKRPICRYVKVGGWAYETLLRLGWKELHVVVWKDRDGTPRAYVKMEKPDDQENSRLHRRK